MADDEGTGNGRPPEDDDATEFGPASGDDATELTPTRATDGFEIPPGDPEAMPERVGEFKVLRKLGEGGMGVVFEAEQSHPQRRVAVKIIRGGRFVDPMVIQMFEREAQALARLKHPGIAPIYEVGKTDDGHHFLAMELVRGKTLDQFLKGRPDPARDPAELDFRLGLFRQICDAVHYAHQRGVIHRDLKPNNIMVLRTRSRIDTDPSHPELPEIRILDFGMARITDPDLPMAERITRMGQVQGTLAYMSPEQARGNPDEIDLRTDIYALGIILYEMLTGTRPYDAQRAALVEAVRVICEEAPKSFSDSLGGTSRFDRDLETIALKALEKDPERRYQSITTFAGDVNRYLGQQPILARPPSAVYQMRKMVSRHRFVFGFAATVAFLIVVLAATMTVQAKRIARERDDKDAALRAETLVVELMIDAFNVADPNIAKGREVTAREVLENASTLIDDRLGDNPAAKSRMLTTMGRVYTKLEANEEARSLLESSVRLMRSGDFTPVDGADPRFWLAYLLVEDGELDRAETLYREFAEARMARHGPDDRFVMEAHVNLGVIAEKRGDVNGAVAEYREALRIAAAIGPGADKDAAAIYNNLGVLFDRYKGDYREAVRQYEKALDLRVAEFGEMHTYVATTTGNLAELHRKLENWDDAERYYLRSLAIREQLLGPQSVRVAIIRNNLGEMQFDRGNIEDAEQAFDQARQVFVDKHGTDHPYVGFATLNLGRVELAKNNPVKAEILIRRSLAIFEAPATANALDTAVCRAQLAAALRDQGRLGDSESEFTASMKSIESGFGASHPDLADVLDEYAALLRLQGRSGEADDAERRAGAIREVVSET